MRSGEALRLGRCSNLPPQFGLSCFPAQNVHLYEQMYAFLARNPISSAIPLLARVARSK
jgi:hypothetical protein